MRIVVFRGPTPGSGLGRGTWDPGATLAVVCRRPGASSARLGEQVWAGEHRIAFGCRVKGGEGRL